MGIQGLLQALKSSGQPINVSEYKNQKVAIDTYGWLHKGCIQCAAELAQGIPTAKYIQFVMHRVNLLRHFKVIPVMVFDGGFLPMKKETEEERRRNREHNVQKAMELLRSGNRSQAEDFFQRAVDVTPLMAHSLMQTLREEGVEFFVAPYEADAQLAYLARTGYVSAVISEDSDLIAYQSPRVLYKMDKFGNGLEIQMVRLPMNKDLNFNHFTPTMILTTCIMAGCDYLPGLPGIALKTAHRLVKQYRSIECILQILLAESKYSFTPQDLVAYASKFQQAMRTFHHHYVYDPTTRTIQNLTPCPDTEGHVEGDWDFLGHRMDTATARSVCEGYANPYTYELYSTEPTADARLYRSHSGRRLSGQDPRESVAAAPLNSVELMGQRKVTSFFSLAAPPAVAPAAPALPQSQATRAEFKAPRPKSPEAGDLALATAPGPCGAKRLISDAADAEPAPAKRKRVRLSRYFAVLQDDTSPGNAEFDAPPGADSAPSAPSEAVPDAATALRSSPPPPRSPHSEELCPHGNVQCTGRHSVFYDCTRALTPPDVSGADVAPHGPETPISTSGNNPAVVTQAETALEGGIAVAETEAAVASATEAAAAPTAALGGAAAASADPVRQQSPEPVRPPALGKENLSENVPRNACPDPASLKRCHGAGGGTTLPKHLAKIPARARGTPLVNPKLSSVGLKPTNRKPSALAAFMSRPKPEGPGAEAAAGGPVDFSAFFFRGDVRSGHQ